MNSLWVQLKSKHELNISNKIKSKTTWVSYKKRKSLVNILISLSIRTKRASLMNDKESISLIKVQCEVWVKSEQWMSYIKMTDDAYQLNVVCQFLVKQLKWQTENSDLQATNFDDWSLFIYKIISLQLQVQNSKENVMRITESFTVIQNAPWDIMLELFFLKQYDSIWSYKKREIQ